MTTLARQIFEQLDSTGDAELLPEMLASMRTDDTLLSMYGENLQGILDRFESVYSKEEHWECIINAADAVMLTSHLTTVLQALTTKAAGVLAMLATREWGKATHLGTQKYTGEIFTKITGPDDIVDPEWVIKETLGDDVELVEVN